MSLLDISAFLNSFYRSDTQQRQISLCLLVCLKNRHFFFSDEWLFFFRKVIVNIFSYWNADKICSVFGSKKYKLCFTSPWWSINPNTKKISVWKLRGLTLNRNILKTLFLKCICFLWIYLVYSPCKECLLAFSCTDHGMWSLHVTSHLFPRL